jgi:uncharacterized protein YndB with AHSA1/START domain
VGYTIEVTREAAVDPRDIFDLYMDPSTWSTWGHNVRWAHADGALAEGGTVDIRPIYPVTYHCRIQRLVPGRLLRIEASLDDEVRHCVEFAQSQAAASP